MTAIELIEHLTYCDDLLREVHRILKPNGYFMLTTPNLASYMNRFLLLFGYQPKYTQPSKYLWIGLPKKVRPLKTPDVYELGHKNLLTLRALKDALEAYGFRPLIFKGSPGGGDSGPLDKILSKASASLASIIITLARKI